MRLSRPVLAGLVGAVAAAGAGTALVASGGDGGGSGQGARGLAFDGPAQVLRTPELPDDTVLRTALRNVSLREVVLDADEARLLDAEGRAVEAVVRFTGAFGHGLYSPRNAPKEVAAAERARLGEVAELRPDRTVPLTVSWRVAPGAAPPVVLDLGGEQRLALPAAAAGT